MEQQTKAEFLSGDYGELGIVGSTEEELDMICAFIDTHARKFPDIGYHRNGIYLRFSHSGYSKGTALSELARPPRVLVCASATGYYGDRGEEWLDEGSPPGGGFLSECLTRVLREMEIAARCG